jgi:hypothetical protein
MTERKPSRLKRWLRGVGITIAVIVVTVAAIILTESPWPLFWIPIAVAIWWGLWDTINGYVARKAYEKKRKADELERRFANIYSQLNRIEGQLEQLGRRGQLNRIEEKLDATAASVSERPPGSAGVAVEV